MQSRLRILGIQQEVGIGQDHAQPRLSPSSSDRSSWMLSSCIPDLRVSGRGCVTYGFRRAGTSRIRKPCRSAC
jgi:hypothetical protein